MNFIIKHADDSFELDTNNKITKIRGKTRRYNARILFYLNKVTFSMPRLYGRLNPSDPVDSWFSIFQQTYSRLLSQELEMSKFNFDFSFQISTGKFVVEGKVNGSDVAVKTSPIERPEILSSGVSSSVAVDAFYSQSLEKLKPYFIPSCRVGLFSAFNRFTVLQFERSSGIPKTLGLIADFINSIVLPPGYSDLVLGRRIHVGEQEVLCDDMPVYNCEPEVINQAILNFFIKNTEESSIAFLEDPCLYDVDVNSISSEFKGKLVLITR
ncbi:hypothetical protein [Sulfuracidifex metallicus]|uniref:Uncharacterized protein n=1 Tax=Sulfuracidifex metallicus DSM 6482 = JCM 9184 TaxID=523847 RepID=A0A6A9QNV6_SULME|nr:hypothetical protein [Sulfuracidifex metallicus]MUN29428.1 hypothetical protein [Sulfuracidifex metallicus DSM 6482 = JCM 9184]WOE50060.1 hypothetical protein RQ359_001561 [Sulfuracidifex metallicus DSM 6482 = JCM 9184]